MTNCTYDYDALDRLISQSDNSGFKLWDYDANSNRTTAQFGGTGYPYIIASTSNRLTSAAGPVAKNYSYDVAGNPLSDGATTFTWNAAGKLATTVKSTKTHTYKTNALDQRISKNGPLSSKFFFFYDPAGQLIGEYKDNASTATPTDDWLVRQETIWLEDIPVAVIKKPTATGLIQVYFIHADHLNTPRVIVNQSNTPVWHWENTHAFGANLPNENPDSNGQLFEYHQRFPGQYFDKETNLHYNYFRYYEPEIGRYISPDPIGLMEGVNVYNYVGVNPVLLVDPFGLRVLNPRNYSVSPEVMESLWTFNSQVGCDKDIVITGGDRSSNSKYGAGSRSTHVQGIAADISIPGQSHPETANQASESGLFGGVGWYEEGYRGPNGEGPHTHIDLRKSRAQWGHPAKGATMRGYFPSHDVKLNKNNCLCLRN